MWTPTSEMCTGRSRLWISINMQIATGVLHRRFERAFLFYISWVEFGMSGASVVSKEKEKQLGLNVNQSINPDLNKPGV